MKTFIVRYKVKADKAAENIAFIKQVFAELEKTKPEGIRYVSFVLEDGLSFVHVASIEAADDSNPLLSLDAFKAFGKDIASRCDEPPKPVPASVVGSYQVF